MNLTDDEILKFQKGTPVLLKDICAVRSVTIGEIVDLGYSKFQQYLGILTAEKPIVSKKDDPEAAQVLEELSDFEYILMLATMDLEINTLLKEAFQFFTNESVAFSISPAQIVVGPIAEKHLLTEEDFYDLQRLLRRCYFLDQDGEEIIIYPNDDAAVRQLKMQMRANREKVRRAKAKQAEKEKSDLRFSDLIGSITINNCGLNILNIYDVPYYALQDQLKRMGWRDQFDINNRAALAGAKLKKNQLKHWMRSINDSEKS